MKLIALCGSQGSGKTTAAKILEKQLSYYRFPFASPLKRMLREGLGLTWEHTDGSLKELPCHELMGKTPRYAMQTLGTEWGRNCIGPELWVETWKRQVKEYMPSVVVDDARFENEFNAVRSLGGIVVHIDRPWHVAPFEHASEVDWVFTRKDHRVVNETLEGLEARLKEIVSEYDEEAASGNGRSRVGLCSD